MGLLKEFRDFLNEYKVVGLAVAFIIGTAASALVKALVDDIIMPFVGPLIPGGDWRIATLTVWKFAFKWGDFLGAIINFVIIAFVVFMIAKFVLKEPKVTKK